MSLAIQTDEVVAVLLSDGWHKVARKSFDTDAYEYMGGDDAIFHGGQSELVCRPECFRRRRGRDSILGCVGCYGCSRGSKHVDYAVLSGHIYFLRSES